MATTEELPDNIEFQLTLCAAAAESLTEADCRAESVMRKEIRDAIGLHSEDEITWLIEMVEMRLLDNYYPAVTIKTAAWRYDLSWGFLSKDGKAAREWGIWVNDVTIGRDAPKLRRAKSAMTSQQIDVALSIPKLLEAIRAATISAEAGFNSVRWTGYI